MGLNDATRILSVIDQRIDKNTGSNITQTYGQIESITGQEAAVWIAGSREIAIAAGETPEALGGFRVPAWMALNIGDFVRVSISATGGQWIEEVIPAAPYPRLAIDVSGGKMLVGTGSTAPVAGAPSQVMGIGTDGSFAWQDNTNSTVVPFSLDSPPANTTTAMSPIDAAMSAATKRLQIPWAFQIVGVSVKLSTPITSGTMTVVPTLQGSPASFSVQLTSTQDSATGKGSRAAVANQGSASQAVGVNITTSATFAPTTMRVTVALFVAINYADSTSIVTGVFTADAVLKSSLLSGTYQFNADAILRRLGIAGSFTADAVLSAVEGPPAALQSGNSILASTGAILGTIVLGDVGGGVTPPPEPPPVTPPPTSGTVEHGSTDRLMLHSG